MSVIVEAASQTRLPYLWGAPTYKQARVCFEEAQRAAKDVAKFNEARLTMSLPGRGTVLFAGLDKFDNLRGFSAAGVVVDEIQNTKQAAYYEVLLPMLIDNGGWFWGIGTSNGKDWFFLERQAAVGMADTAVFRAPTLGVAIVDNQLVRQPHPLENPFVKFSEMERLFAIMPRHAFRREFMSDDEAAPGDLVYDVWLDMSDSADPPGNVTEKADYVPGNGRVYWAVDDGYSAGLASNTAGINTETGTYVANAHPRVFLLCQMRPDGTLCVFAESYACLKLQNEHIEEVLQLPYPRPHFAAVDRSAAELRGRLQKIRIPALKGGSSVDEQIKELRQWLGADQNGVRRLLVHPRCQHLRSEMMSYRLDEDGKPVKEFDHGPDALKYLVWRLRHTN